MQSLGAPLPSKVHLGLVLSYRSDHMSHRQKRLHVSMPAYVGWHD